MTTPDNLFVSDHPLMIDKISQLRDETTSHSNFRVLLEDISQLLFYEASRNLATVPEEVTTPLETIAARRLKHDPLLVPILRAGLGMVNGIVKICKEARVGMIGMYRDERTLQPVDYYLSLPAEMGHQQVFLLDPMLATGGSAISAAETLKSKGVKRINMLAVLSAPEGIEALLNAHPEIQIYTAGLDRELNGKGYILPGLGDAGDRYFGT